MPSKPKGTADREGALVNVKGVSRSTRLGDLTVGQFVELMLQIGPYLGTGLQKQKQGEVFEAILAQLRRYFEEAPTSSDSEAAAAVLRRDLGSVRKVEDIAEAVRHAQIAILDQMPYRLEQMRSSLKKE
jgi:hypothetical protein